MEESTIPRIPTFVDTDSYLARCEKVTEFYSWKDDDLTLHLGFFVKVKAKALKVDVG